MLCPYCGIKLFRNKYNDLVCPIDGIVINNKEEDEEENTENKERSYIN